MLAGVGAGKRSPRRGRREAETADAESLKQEGQRHAEGAPRWLPPETSFPSAARWGPCPPGGSPILVPVSPAAREAGSLPAPRGQRWGSQECVEGARVQPGPNQGSWRQLRVCNLGWGLTGGGGFAGGDNGAEQSPGGGDGGAPGGVGASPPSPWVA